MGHRYYAAQYLNRFTLSTNKKAKITLAPEEWISPAEAARLRGVSRQAISKLIQNRRVTVLDIAGIVLVKRADVLAFKPRKAGRPKRQTNAERN